MTHWLGRSLPRWLPPLAFFCFAPLWETIYLGQINLFVLLAVVLGACAALSRREWLAGVAVGIGVILKVSPGLLVLYFMATRQWRAIAAMVLTVLACSAGAAAVWGPDIVIDYLHMTMRLSAEIHPSLNNQSVLSYLGRGIGWFPLGADIARWIHRLLLLAIVAAFVVRGWRGMRRPEALYAGLTVLLIAYAPIVWYHHNAVLLVPMMLLTPFAPLAVVASYALIQSARVLDLAFPTLPLAGALVISGQVMLGWAAWKALQPAPTRATTSERMTAPAVGD